jgi:biopolymer transport protein ExbD
VRITHKRKTLHTEINMVPFIDIVLVLLIIFMIVSPFLAQSELPIRLPKALSGQNTQADEPFHIRVSKDGDIHLGPERVVRTDLEARLKTLVNQKGVRAILIEADRDVSFKNVVFALDAAERSGASKIGVAVENPTPEP